MSKPFSGSTRAFHLLSRGLMVFIAWIGAQAALGESAGVAEIVFVVACLSLNAIRASVARSRHERVNVLTWSVLFVALPFAYFLWKISSSSALPLELLLGPMIVAMAVPFQIFASFYPGVPKAQHLVMIFVLVESVLAARSGAESGSWLIILLLLGLMIPSMALAHCAEESQARTRSRYSEPGSILRFSTLGLLFGAGFCALSVMILLFLIVPRKGEPGSKPALEVQKKNEAEPWKGLSGADLLAPGSVASAGISDRMDLGSVSEILNTEQALFTVEISTHQKSEPVPADLLENPLFRVNVFSEWQSGSFSPVEGEASSDAWLSDGRLSLAAVHPQAAIIRNHQSGFVPVTSRLEAIDDSLTGLQKLPALANLIGISDVRNGHGGLWNGRINRSWENELIRLQPDPEGQIPTTLVTQSMVLRRPFRVRRSLNRPDQVLLPGLNPIDQDTSAYLAKNFHEFGEFAQLANDRLQLANQLEDWFGNGLEYEYSLGGAPQGEKALLDFICRKESRIGHCEFYASAMVLILRALGHPARVAVGFAPGPLPETADSRSLPRWEVNTGHAHAWVEVFFDELGWVSFDPTPPARFAPTGVDDNELSEPLAPEPLQDHLSTAKPDSQPEIDLNQAIARFDGQGRRELNAWVSSRTPALC